MSIASPAIAGSAPDTPAGEAQPPERVDHTEAWRTTLAARRAARVQNLRVYATRRQFPLNLGEPGLAHVFMDHRGVRCAMAELIWQSGAKDLVMHYVETDNDVVIAEQTDGPLIDWVLTSGLTMEEVAFVQVPGFNVSEWEETGGPRAPVARAVDPDKRALAVETQRRRAHFRMALRQLEVSEPASLDLAIERLGDRVYTPPPSDAPPPEHTAAR